MTIYFPRLHHPAAAPVEPPVEVPRRPRPKDRTIARLLGLLPPVRRRRLLAGALAEQHHQLFDLDADSQYPVPSVMRNGVTS